MHDSTPTRMYLSLSLPPLSPPFFPVPPPWSPKSHAAFRNIREPLARVNVQKSAPLSKVSGKSNPHSVAHDLRARPRACTRVHLRISRLLFREKYDFSIIIATFHPFSRLSKNEFEFREERGRFLFYRLSLIEETIYIYMYRVKIYSINSVT